MKKEELVFVYNADSGIFNALMDSLHKIFSPSTYDCNLCAITYSAVRMKREWKSFIDGLPVPVHFLHKDELKKQFNRDDLSLPSVLVLRENSLEVLIEAREINQVWSLEQLKGLVERKSSFL